MKRPAHFKQDTPVMQYATIMQAICGWLSNYAEGITKPERALEHLQRHGEDLQTLAPFLKQGSWEIPEEVNPFRSSEAPTAYEAGYRNALQDLKVALTFKGRPEVTAAWENGYITALEDVGHQIDRIRAGVIPVDGQLGRGEDGG